jgi:hypothetical protein
MASVVVVEKSYGAGAFIALNMYEGQRMSIAAQ